jgi:hypothetical protein
MAAGMTDHVWTTAEWLSYRVPAEFIDQLSTIEQVFPDLGGRSHPLRDTTLFYCQGFFYPINIFNPQA